MTFIDVLTVVWALALIMVVMIIINAIKTTNKRRELRKEEIKTRINFLKKELKVVKIKLKAAENLKDKSLSLSLNSVINDYQKCIHNLDKELEVLNG